MEVPRLEIESVAATVPDHLTHHAGPGLKPAPLHQPKSLLCQVFNPLCHSRNSLIAFSFPGQFLFLVVSASYESSQARDQIHAIAVTQDSAETTLDP